MFKLFTKKSTWLMYLSLILLIIGGALLTSNNQEEYSLNWKKQLEKENQTLIQENEEFLETAGMEPIINTNKETIKKNRYYIENDIKPVKSGAFNVVLDNAGLLSIVSLFTIIIGASIVSDEYKWGTIKFLLVRPYSRNMILFIKYISVLLFTCITILFVQIFSFLIGSSLLGIEGFNPINITIGNGEVIESNMFVSILAEYGYKLINLIMMTTLAFAISTIFKNSNIAISLGVFLMLSGNMIVTTLADKPFTKYILFANTNLKQYQENSSIIEGTSLTFSIIILIIYYIIFLFSSFIIFNRKDITTDG
ncbi:ABC transporter permease subunit [Virgibacillus massiliensis]|nr:ABC transporter permease subunit [Virgibacillus massiliensis]